MPICASQSTNMAAAREITLLCSTLLALFAGGQGNSNCFIGNTHYEICAFGCCGTFPYEECCSDIAALAIGLTVAGVLVIVVIITVVCCVLYHKSNNQVVRLQETAHSQGDTANITILHMSSNNPYERVPHPHSHMMTMPSDPNQPAMLPHDVPSGFQQHKGHQHNPAPGFPAMPPNPSAPGVDPAFPPGHRPPPAAGLQTVSSGIMMMPSPSMNGGPGMMPSSSGGPNGFPPSFSSTNQGPGMMPPSSSMNGDPPSMGGTAPAITSSSTLSALTPRKVPPLPSIPVAAGVSSPEPPPPSFSAFGAPLGKAGMGRKQSTSLETTGKTANDDSNMGVEDIEEID